ncbi:hypothetical protein VSY18_28570 (plasmid) [Bacillus albus]|uniref:hypothetical protein n=1 Tax=Bacillus TaxID=1386 RepID=UPI000B4B297C|nr:MULTISPECIES: hypothetical protein [Bacillus]MCP1166569.1 hypothetical protein [Bacillus sp. 1813sda1]MDA2030067.1 hypothetical protein [Bacillus cereus group sp. Bcc03]MDA2219841.1 hypothetical protein [Bacillus cereus group sp. Bc228]MDA2231128.1 hypothetical protein [Bacillus cereus group sp. Bc227]MDA2263856.1 hypothetical protein [Bacillus cereus group sp. Bc200]
MNSYTNKQKIVSLIIASFIFFSFVLTGIYNVTKSNFFYVNLAGLTLNSFMLFVAAKALMKQIKD